MSNYSRSPKLWIFLSGVVIVAAAVPQLIDYPEGHPFFFISHEFLKSLSTSEFSSQLKGIFDLTDYLDDMASFGVGFCKSYGLDLEIEDLRNFIGDRVLAGNGQDSVDRAMQIIVATTDVDRLTQIEPWDPNTISASFANDIWADSKIRIEEIIPRGLIREINKCTILATFDSFLQAYDFFLNSHISNPGANPHPSEIAICAPSLLDEKISWLSLNDGPSKILQRKIYHELLNLKFLESLTATLPLQEQSILSNEFNSNHIRYYDSLSRCQQLLERNLTKSDALSIEYSKILNAPIDINF